MIPTITDSSQFSVQYLMFTAGSTETVPTAWKWSSKLLSCYPTCHMSLHKQERALNCVLRGELFRTRLSFGLVFKHSLQFSECNIMSNTARLIFVLLQIYFYLAKLVVWFLMHNNNSHTKHIRQTCRSFKSC